MEEFKILDIEEEVLASRIELIIKECVLISKEIRESIDENKTNDELLDDEKFRSWVILNEIINSLQKNDDNFNRMFYYLYEKCKKDVNSLISFYDIEIEKDENNNIKKITLINYE